MHINIMNPTLVRRVLILYLFIRTCFAGISIEASNSNGSTDLVKAAIKVLTSCYGSGMTEIGIAGNSTDTLISSLSDSFSAVLLDNGQRSVKSGPVSRISRHKLQLFVIVVTASMELKEILVNIKNSRWWNHMALFYIVEWPVNERGCSRAYEILRTAWKMDLLEAKFMCTNLNEERLIYGFNPYTQDPPEPWKLSKIYRGPNDHPWALLVRKYQDNSDICDKMDFDKTHDLAGYVIRASVPQSSFYLSVNISRTGVDAIFGPHSDIIRSLISAMNATAELLIHNKNEKVGSVDRKGKAHGNLATTVNGISDIFFTNFDTRNLARVASIYPHGTSKITILTQYRGYKSQLGKIATVIDGISRFFLAVVILITLIFIKYCLRETLPTAILDTIRLICNSSLPKIPYDLPPRIYLTSLFLFIVTIQGLYQGQLASLLAKQVPLQDINTLENLAESEHKIYGYNEYRKLFNEQEIEGRYVGLDKKYNCTDLVLHDNLAACVKSWKFHVIAAAYWKLHISSDSIGYFPITWPIRNNWPLERRINIMVQRLVEGNLFQYTDNEIFKKPLRQVEANNNENKDRTRKILELGDLSFAFAILGIGLGCATICFIVELGISRDFRLRNAKTRLHFQLRR